MRLLRDRRGNAIAIAAGSLIPLIGFSGSAVDMARLYIVKVRLQQACDAGVLAGRRVMTDTSMSTPLEPKAKDQAQAFFNNNFRKDYLRSTGIEFKPVKAASGDATVGNAVTATASATVPLSVMGYFSMKPVKINVACQAVFDLADTDVMFVLDTTGSMSCLPSDPANCAVTPQVSYRRSDGTTGYANPEKNGSKLDALRDAVILFDDTMRANADKTSRFRYGFVTYSSGVNVGGSIPPQYLQKADWTYQSRALSPDVPNVRQALPGDYAYGNSTSVSLTGVPKALCVEQRTPTTGFAKTGYTWSDQGYYQARSYYNLSWTAANGGTCSGTQQPLRARWRYGPVTYSIDQFVARQSVVNPSRLDGSRNRWRGCIEELNTTPGSNFDVTNLPDDLDPDVIPSSANNMWRPQWPDVVWSRRFIGTEDVDDDDIVELGVSQEWSKRLQSPPPLYTRNYGSGYFNDDTGSAACGMPAQPLRVWTAQDVKNYVNDPDFKPVGGTYHDVGMIWGTRMLSPDGVFADNNKVPSGRKEPTRNIVFMTDGAMAPNQLVYGQYGIEQWDNRTGGQSNAARDLDNHNARFRVECDAAKRKGYTIYVVALGTAVTNDLTFCASPGQTYQASSTAQLTAAFRSIAQRVAMLRISQ